MPDCFSKTVLRPMRGLILLASILATLSVSLFGQEVDFHPEPVMSVTGKIGSFRGLKFSHHDRRLWNQRLNCWDVPEGFALDRPPVDLKNNWQIFDAAAKGGRMVFVDAKKERLIAWGGVSPLTERPLPNQGTIRSIRFLEGEEWFASWATEPSAICVGQVRSSKHDRYVTVPDGLKKVNISRTGKLLAVVHPDDVKSVLIWDLKENQKRAVIQQKSVVASHSLSPGDRFLATGSFDNKVRIYDAESGRQLKVLKGHGKGPIFLGSAVFSVAFSPDGRWLASGGHDGQVIVWEVESGKTVLKANIKSQPIVWSVAFSQNSKLVAGGFEGVGPVRGVGVWQVEPKSSSELVKTGFAASACDFEFDLSGPSKGKFAFRPSGHSNHRRSELNRTKYGQVLLQSNFIKCARVQDTRFAMVISNNSLWYSADFLCCR